MYASKKIKIAYLKADKTSVKVRSKNAHFVDIFLLNLAIKLPKHMTINDYAIKLVYDWQSSYGHIYILGLVELET